MHALAPVLALALSGSAFAVESTQDLGPAADAATLDGAARERSGHRPSGARPAPSSRSGSSARPAPSSRSGSSARPAPSRASGSYRPPARPATSPPPRPRPSTGRPPTTSRPVARGPVVVRRAAPRPVVVTRPVRVVRPYSGVFVYGPRPVHHVHYVDRPVEQVEEEHLPTRKVDRKGQWALGLSGGSLIGGYKSGGGAYADFGMGLAARYRPLEAIGLEVALTHHDETFRAESERRQTVVQASAMAFITPWARLSPYVVAGVTGSGVDIDDQLAFDDADVTVDQRGLLFGPHAGGGLELNLSQSLSLGADARVIGYVNQPREGLAVPAQLQVSGGLRVHF